MMCAAWGEAILELNVRVVGSPELKRNRGDVLNCVISDVVHLCYFSL